MSMRGWPCCSTSWDPLPPSAAFSSPTLLPRAPPPPLGGLGPCMSMRDWPYCLTSWDAPPHQSLPRSSHHHFKLLCFLQSTPIRYVDARLAILLDVLGCSDPISRFLVLNTTTSSSSASFSRP